MKKLSVLLFVLFFLSCFCVYGQVMPVIDASLNTLMTITGIDQMISYGLMLIDSASQIEHMISMVKNMGQQVAMQVQNLQSIGDIESWSDFKDFYNRQLYLERQTIDKFNNMNIDIGGKSYHLTDIEGIATGYGNQTKEFWTNEFTEEQRKAMWLELGLTPSNYAFVQPFRQKALDISREFISSREIQNDWYKKNMERNNKIREKLKTDSTKKTEDKMGEKEVLQYISETLLDSNKVLNDIAMQNAAMMEMQAVNYYLNQTPADKKLLSDWPDDNEFGFASLK